METPYSIYSLISKCYKYNESIVLGHYSTQEKAIDLARKLMINHKAENVSDLVRLTRGVKYDYISYYGGHECAYEIIPITVE